MTNPYLVKIFEHNRWANLKIIQACAGLTSEQLDAPPPTAAKGSIRRTLIHLVSSERGYLEELTLPVDQRLAESVDFANLEESARASGEDFIALAQNGLESLKSPLQTADGFNVDPWVVVLQAINHATEHREQIKSMLTALGVTPPEVDGWDYGLATGALVPIAK